MASNKNAYLERQRQRDQAFFEAGERIGIQKMWDYMQIALRDPDIMKKDVFGRSRLEKLFLKSKELADYFHTAFTDDKEADLVQRDLVQRDMDAALREIWGSDLSTFYERYPQLKKLDYHKPRKSWRE